MGSVSGRRSQAFRRWMSLLGGIVGVLLTLAVLPSRAVAKAKDDNAATLTNQLVQTVGNYRRASALMRRNMHSELATIVAKRKAALLDEMNTDPGAFLRHALSPSIGAQLPPELQSDMEKEVDVEGEVAMVWAEDFSHHRAELFKQLKIAGTQTPLTLHFAGEAPSLRTGAKVKARGVKLGSHLALAQSGGSGVQTTAASSVDASLVGGVQPTIVMALNFQDKSLDCSTSSMNGLMFGATNSVTSCYQETSFNQMSVSGIVVGPYTIPFPSTACDYNSWANAADQAATAAGINLGAYPHRIYVLPSNGCPYAGLGTVGGNPSQAWILGYCSTADVYAHEFGHNIGMNHASTPSSEYGDLSDLMGYSGVGLRQVNTAHKLQMGWVPSARVQTVTGSSTYTIASLETAGTQLQALKIAKPDTGEFYYIGYRLPIGYDAALSSSYANDINIHRQSGGGNTVFLSALSDGISFQDAVNKITVTQTSHDASGAVVSVSMEGAPPCSPSAPTMSLTPLNQTGSQGQLVKYQLSVTNKDTSTCSATTFTIGNLLPLGWTGSASPTTLSLLPGTSGSSTWSVASTLATLTGSYAITAKISDGAGAVHNTSADATYVVFGDVTPPTVNITAPANGADISGRVKISVTASDDVGVTKLELWIDGVLKATTTATSFNYTWQTRKISAGLHQIQAKAFDGAGHATTAAISVNLLARSVRQARVAARIK